MNWTILIVTVCGPLCLWFFLMASVGMHQGWEKRNTKGEGGGDYMLALVFILMGSVCLGLTLGAIFK